MIKINEIDISFLSAGHYSFTNSEVLLLLVDYKKGCNAELNLIDDP